MGDRLPLCALLASRRVLDLRVSVFRLRLWNGLTDICCDDGANSGVFSLSTRRRFSVCPKVSETALRLLDKPRTPTFAVVGSVNGSS